MKKLLGLFIVFVLVILCCGCGGGKTSSTIDLFGEKDKQLSKEAVEERVSQLISQGSGLYDFYIDMSNLAEAKTTHNGVIYFKILSSSPYKTVESLKIATETIFTKEYAEKYFYKEFLEGENPIIIEKNNMVYKNSNYKGSEMEYIWMHDTLSIKTQSDDEIILEMDVLKPDGETGKEELKIKKVNDFWYLNSGLDCGSVFK